MSASTHIADSNLFGGSPRWGSPVVFDSNRQAVGDNVKNYEIYVMNSDGTGQVQLTNDNNYDTWWPKPSPDRTKILFVRTPVGVHDTDYKQVTTWVMNSDGTGLTQILPLGVYGWQIQGHPEWKPDGTKIATMGGTASSNSQIYMVDSNGANPVKITGGASGPARPGTNVDPSWSPDGSKLLFIGCPTAICLASRQEVYSVNSDGSGETRLTNDKKPDNDPYYSPDGNTIAWLRNTSTHTLTRWAIFSMNPNGSGQAPVIDDGQINSKPAWSIDGSKIFFHRTPMLGVPFNVWSIQPNGGGMTQIITPAPTTFDNEYPVNGNF